MKYTLTCDQCDIKRLIDFGDLNDGDIFYDRESGQLFMKIEEHLDDYKATINAIYLETGECTCWSNFTEVEKYMGTFDFKTSSFVKYWEDLDA